MSRLALVLMVVIGAGGCGDGRSGQTSITDPCVKFSSCGECTPIHGCGWCSTGRDGGVCLQDPLECPGPQFTWTWEPIACTGGADAGAPPGEAGTPSDGPMCRWPAAANTFASTDAGATGCLPSAGGSLCSGSQYALACHGAGGAPPPPDAALQCAVVPVPTPSNVLFYCCPCSS